MEDQAQERALPTKRERHGFTRMATLANDAREAVSRAAGKVLTGNLDDGHYALMEAGDAVYRLLRLINRSVKLVERQMANQPVADLPREPPDPELLAEYPQKYPIGTKVVSLRGYGGVFRRGEAATIAAYKPGVGYELKLQDGRMFRYLEEDVLEPANNDR